MRIARALVGLGAVTSSSLAPVSAVVERRLGAPGRPAAGAGRDGVLRDERASRDHRDARQRTERAQRPGRPHRRRLGRRASTAPPATTGCAARRRHAPPSPERIIQVPDNPNLEPGNGPFTIELRYRTQENFGNITQKGQAQTQGGQWKIQAPQGIPSCLFKGSGGQVATGAKTPLNDEQWHNLTCVLTSTGVTMYVDGEFRNRKNGPTGTIDNNIPMTIGGKINCDQIDDHLRLLLRPDRLHQDHQGGQPQPDRRLLQLLLRADLRLRLVGLGGRRRQPDPVRLGLRRRADVDGGQPVPHLRRAGHLHRPAHGDRQPGGHRQRDQPVTVEDAGRSRARSSTSPPRRRRPTTASPTVTVPAAAAPGDRLLMVLSYNNLTRTVSAPTGVTGWTQLDSVAAGTMGTVAWTKVVQPGDPGTPVTVPLSGAAKYTLTLADYTGTEATPSVDFAQRDRRGDHELAPDADRDRVRGRLGRVVLGRQVRHDDRLDAAASVTTRRTACGADGGRICSALADSGAALPPGPYGNIEATTNAPSDKATMWSFVLRTLDGRPAAQPAADGRLLLRRARCSTATSTRPTPIDPDGTITSYAWDFGDGDTSTRGQPRATPSRRPGTYDVDADRHRRRRRVRQR